MISGICIAGVLIPKRTASAVILLTITSALFSYFLLTGDVLLFLVVLLVLASGIVTLFGRWWQQKPDPPAPEPSRDDLSLSEERYRQISNVMTDTAFAMAYDEKSDSFVLEWYVGSSEHLTGYTPEDEFDAELVKNHICHPEDYPRLVADMEATKQGRETEGVYRLYTKGGDVRWRTIRRVG